MNSTCRLPYRTLCALTASSSTPHLYEEPGYARCELDSHADTCVAGVNFVILDTTCKSVDVHSYSNELDVLTNIPIATVGTVWTQPVTGELYLLVINQCIFFGDRLKHSLICPNQLRSHGVVVNDVPVQFDKSSQHAIIHEKVTIPLEMAGVVSYFETRLPRSDEIDALPQVVLTSPSDWAVYSSTIHESEPSG
jgi:hypothetical protein